MLGYLKTACIMPSIKIGNIDFNLKCMKEEILNAIALNCKFCVFPKLSLTGISLNDLFHDNNILISSENALLDIKNFSIDKDIIIVISLPLKIHNNIYEVAAVIKSGAIIGIVPNLHEDNYNKNIFNRSLLSDDTYELFDKDHNEILNIHFAENLVFNNNVFSFKVVFDDNITTNQNVNFIVNLTTVPETIGIDDTIKNLKKISKDICSTIINVSPGPAESSGNYVFFGRSMVIEDGEIIARNDILTNHLLLCDIDLDKSCKIISSSDASNVSFMYDNYYQNDFNEKLYREFDKTPYINKKVNPYNFSIHIINILSVALAKRMNAIKSQNIVLGISGGLDSTIALLVAKKTCEFLSLSNENIHAISMPGFGTTDNSNKNINNLLSALNVKLNVVDIKNTTMSHLSDIRHDINNTNVTYENAQARERTQVLMDIANDINGIVVGTSDLSEIALGFSTYNGDHMSMYNVNGSLYKTLIRYILNSIADYNLDKNVALTNVLKDILNSPITPELKPTENGILLQKTEDILGNYEIHDFVLYNYLKYSYDINKLYDLTLRTFITGQSKYSNEYIKNCLNVFFDRFYKAQYKRSTAPDSPDIGLPNLSKKFSIPNDLEMNITL